MIPYVALQYVSTTADTVHLKYRCEACGVESPAIVSAVTRGVAEAPYLVGQGAASEQAERNAAAALPAAIRRVVGIAGCPHCTRRERTAARSTKLRALLAAASTWFGVLLSLVIIAGAMAIVDTSGLDKLVGLAVVAGAMLLLLAIAAWKYRGLVREAQTLVRWIGHEPDLLAG